MKTKILFTLILLSLLLAGGGFYFARKIYAPFHAPPETLATHLPTKVLKEKPIQTNTIIREKIVYLTNQFNWSQLESSDYRQYIANLREVGCPESTIKDLILTDIMKLYAARRGQFYHNGREFKFWETDEKRKLNARQLDEREKQLASIDKEIPSVLRDLLGVNYEREINKYFIDSQEDERRLNFLTEEKRAQVFALREAFDGRKERILDAANGNPAAADIAALQKLEAARTDELKKIMSASELAEFELRTSPTADRLRGELIGFNPSESEFRHLFELQKAVAEKYAFLPADAEKSGAQQVIQDSLKREWGETRYAEYERAQNPDFREARVFAEVYELPVSAAQTIFEIKQIAQAERENLLANPDFSPDQRHQALNEIQAETEKSLRATLGPKVFAHYSQSTGKWVSHLGGTN